MKLKLYTGKPFKSVGGNLNGLFLVVVLLVYICISHIFLPLFKTRAFLLFARWDLLVFYRPYTYIYDITWDGGQSFLFRDHRKKAKQSGVEIWHVFYRFHQFGNTKMPKHLHEQITNFCKCKKFDLVSLKGSLSDHIIHKKQLKAMWTEPYE